MFVLLSAWWWAWLARGRDRELRTALRVMTLPLAAYLLLSPTVHPWYALILLAFLPFLPPTDDESQTLWLAALPWIYLSGTLVFSYLTYLDPQNFAELEWVRRLEWVPTLLLLTTFLIFKLSETVIRGGGHFRRA
jgi:hypothetical protein